MPRSNALRALDHAALLFVGAAAISAWAAWLHMRDLVHSYGVICGEALGAAPHCAACYATVAFLALAGSCLTLSCVAAAPHRLRSAGRRVRRRLPQA